MATKQRNIEENGIGRQIPPLDTSTFSGSKAMSNLSKSSGVLIPVSADLGNHETKIDYNGRMSIMESCIAPVVNITDVGDIEDIGDEGAFIRYIDGSNTDIVGSDWLAGSTARTKMRDSYIRVVDSKRNEGKVDFGLQLLLAAIPTPIPHNAVNILVCASLPDATVLGAKLKSTLMGSHTIEKNGEQFTVIVRDVKTCTEGVGAFYFARAKGYISGDHPVSILDIGGGTIITHVVEPTGKSVQSTRSVTQKGVKNLAQSIAKDDRLRTFLGSDGDVNLILDVLKNGEAIKLYGRTPFDLTEIIQDRVKAWLTTAVKPAMAKLDEYNNSVEAMLIIGGGSHYLKNSADERVINLRENAQTAHVQGMAIVARQLALKAGGLL